MLPAAGASSQELLAGVQRLLDIFVAKGFALKATLTPHTSSGGGGGGGFTVRLDGPANLWSLQVPPSGRVEPAVVASSRSTTTSSHLCTLRISRVQQLVPAPRRHPCPLAHTACQLPLPLRAALQALAARRSSVYQQHDAAAVAAFLRASGRSSSCRLAWSDTAVTQEWSLQA